ncbi:MAG TPA: hypothetical protein PK771_00635 [Spirochaetota bacterium]|nr:hypothetical protein [Spirochaetota bacterium]
MKKNLLIVDDDYSFIKSILNSNNPDNFNFCFADSVKRAQDMLTYQNFDLIIANSKAPGGDCLNLKNNISKDSTILFLSSSDSDYESLKKSGESCLHKYDIVNKFEVLSNYA